MATFNTRCIVPEMDDLSVQTQIINALEKGAVLCNGTLAELAGDILSAGGLTDTRDESRDRTRERAKAIAGLIKARQDDFDIIALNEVFLEDARDIFVDELKSIFPYYVDKLEGSTICTEDSGLMLFSRWPLLKIGQTGGQNGGPLLPVFRGWTEYDDCRCEDCLADKGAGYVRVQNPHTGDFYHVVFTHMQADAEACPPNVGATPPPSFEAVRSYQLGQVADSLESWIGKKATDWPADTNVIVMGDLNIVGTQAKAAVAAHLDMPDNSEWHEMFDPAQSPGYFAGTPASPNAARPLYDAWAQTTSPWDPGITSGSRKRYDYILLNCVPVAQVPFGAATVTTRPLVPHHMTLLPFNDESDHYGVHAVLNRWQPHCMPAEAVTPQAGYTGPDGSWTGGPDQVTLGPWPNNQFYNMEITVPGGYQWFRFDLPGTYSFSLVDDMGQNDSSDFELRVYPSTDLTNKIHNYYGETTDITEYFVNPNGVAVVHPETIVARKYLVPEPPFYVRISPREPAGKGKYTLYVHRHEGRTKKDAVLLPVNCTQEYFHGLTPLNAEDMPWFQVNLERPDNPAAFQNLRFIVMWQPAGLVGTWVLRLQDENDVVLAVSTDTLTSSTAVNDNDPAYGEATSVQYVEVFSEGLETLSAAANPRFYLRTSRPGLFINGSLSTPYDRYRLRWETNLTIVHGKMWSGTHSLRLKCGDETGSDWSGSDEVGLRVWADGMLLYDLGYNDIGGSATDMDSDDDVSLEKFIRPDDTWVRYVDQFQFQVREDDDGSWGNGQVRTIGPLAPSKSKAWKQSSEVWVDDSDDGNYELFFNRSRSTQYPPCD